MGNEKKNAPDIMTGFSQPHWQQAAKGTLKKMAVRFFAIRYSLFREDRPKLMK